MNYGSARVSTDGQSVEAQVRQLTKPDARRGSARWRAGPRPTAPSFAGCSASLRRGLDRHAARPAGAIHPDTLAAITGKRAGFRSLGQRHGGVLLTASPVDLDQCRSWPQIVPLRLQQGYRATMKSEMLTSDCAKESRIRAGKATHIGSPRHRPPSRWSGGMRRGPTTGSRG
jgi:hypothetical protein